MIVKTTVIIGALAGVLCTPSSALAAADPCGLVTEQEVGTALATPMTMVKDGSDATHCHWQQQGKRGTTVADARLLVESAKTYDTAKGMMGMSGKLKRVPVTGLGDDAYYLVGSRDAPLFVKKGNAAFRVAFDAKGLSLDAIQAKERALALVVLGKV